MEFLIEYGYIGVFIASFLAATVLPFSSEVVLTGVLLAGAAYWPCMIAATLGNFLGGMSCYWLGMLGKVEWIEKYLKLDAVKLQKVQDWIKGKGSWMGFFVFLPGIGDFIAVFYNCGSPGCHSIHSYMEFLIEYGYIGVFIASFLAATVLPFSSEVVLTGVLLAGAAYWPCMIAATLGNFLGGMSCYWLGMLGKVEWIEKYLKLDAVKLQKVQDWIKGKGSWMGFFVFLPGIGDFIAVALGFLRANIWIVAVSMFLGKAIRYWVWMEFVYKVQGMF